MKEGRHDGRDLDRGRVNIVDNAKGLFPVHIPLLCCCLCVAIGIAITIVGLRCSCCSCRVPVELGGKNVVAMLLIADVLTLLMLIMDCW